MNDDLYNNPENNPELPVPVEAPADEPQTTTESSPPPRRSGLARFQDFLQNETVQDLSRILIPTAVEVGGKIAYDKMFGRYERPDYAVTPGLRCYDRISDRLERECFTFPSDNLECAGYFYPAENPKGLVAFAHGLHTGADDYLSIFEFFVNHGYSVAAFDVKGTYDSPGNSTVGLSEAFVELDHMLTAISLDPTLSKLPLYVVGHSCGGFAAAAVLALHPEIRAAATISAMNDANTLIVGKGFVYSSILGVPETPLTSAFLDEHQKKLFGAYTRINGVYAINSTHCPVLIAHGVKDMVVEYMSPVSLIAHRKEIRSDNVDYYIARGDIAAHDAVWRSPDAIRYQAQVKKELEALKKKKGRSFTRDDEVSFVQNVDHSRYSAVNTELFERIVEMFDKA